VGARRCTFEWSLTILPKQKYRWTESTGAVLAISRRTANPQAAYEFLKFLCSPNAEREGVARGGMIPLRTGPRHEAEAYLKSLEFAGMMKSYMSPYCPRVEQDKILKEEIDEFLLGRASVEQALQAVEDRLNEVAQRNLGSI
jgi:ABC-type glycerol-3-phosphate transport system substrate-binding protein